MPTTRVGDIRMYYREEGAGPPLVMLIGYSANSDWWPPALVSLLAQRHRLILLDNRGAGRSENGRRTITIPQMAADTVGLMEVLGITRAMALEWRDRGVRVNSIGPTLMDSPMTKMAAQRTSLTADWIKARMLRQRLGLPRELIGAAIFLASDASELVTGHTIMCDDGYLTQ